MTNLVYFDQQVIQKDFASFTSTDLLSNKSVLGSIFSLIFKSDDSSWNSAFSFACDNSGSLAALIVSKYLYTIDLLHNRINYQFFENIDSRSFVSINSEYIAILCNSKVYLIPRDPGQQQKIINLQSSCISIVCLGDVFYAITNKGSILNVEKNEIVLRNISITGYSIIISSGKNIGIINKSSLILITEELTTITPNIKTNNLFIDPQDATFSSDGQYLFVLDKIADNDSILNLLVFDSQRGFDLSNTIEFPNSSGYLSSWDKNHVVIYDDFGSFNFVSIDTKQIQTQTIKPQSILRGTKDGLLMFEFEDQNGDSFHFNLLRFTAVTPLQLYERNCEQGFLGDALILMRTFNFNKDTYYKASIQQSSLTIQLIDDELSKIQDKDWVYDFCVKTVATTSSIARKLISYGLQIRPNDPLLMKQKERLHIYNIMKSAFKQKDWQEFRDCDMKEKVVKMTKQSLFQKVAIIFAHSSEINEGMKNEIISKISFFTEPNKYVSIMPKNAQIFRERAKMIDEICGQTDLLKQLMQVGSIELPELQLDYMLATEFDTYISELASSTKQILFDIDTSIYMKYIDYFQLTDDQRLLLFLKNVKSGLEFNNNLTTYADSIFKRSPSSLEYVLNDAFLKLEDCIVFPNMAINDRIFEIKTILQKQPKKFATQFANKAVTNFQFELTSPIVTSFINNFSDYLQSNNIIEFLKFAKYSTLYYKSITYTSIDKLDPALIQSVAAMIVQRPKNVWTDFYSLVTKFKVVQDNKELKEKLTGFNITALIQMQDFDNLEITNANDRDIAIDMCKKLILNAKSCDINDPIISGVEICIGKIKPSLNNNSLTSLRLDISLYQQIYKIDYAITPKQVQEAENINVLIISIIKSKEFNDFNQLKEFVLLVQKTIKLIDKIDEIQINTALSELCLNYGNKNKDNSCIDYGYELLSKSSDEIKIEYLKDDVWNDRNKKEAICDERILNSKSLNPFFVQYKSNILLNQKFHDEKSMNNSILDFILRSKIDMNDKLINFAFSFVRPDTGDLIEIFQNYFNYCQNSFEINELIMKLNRANCLNEDEREKLNKFNQTIMSQYADIDTQYEMILKAEKSGVDANEKSKCRIITLKSLKDFGIDYNQSEFNIKQIVSLLLTNKSQIVNSKKNNIFELIKLWHDSALLDQLNENEIVQIVACIQSDQILPNRQFITDILQNEGNELSVFNTNKDLLFAASSSYQNVVNQTTKFDKLPTKIIDSIIEYELVYKFSNTKHFDDILQRCQSKIQIVKIVKSLKEHNQLKAICKLANVCLGIPTQFATLYNADQIIQWLDKSLM